MARPPMVPIARLVVILLAGLAAVVGPAVGQPSALEGTGILEAEAAEGGVPLPLLAMRVELQVTGDLLHGVVTQEFANDLGVAVNVRYSFPLPERAAVHAMELRVGPRTIVAEAREREQARATFEAARREGRKAALVEQQRPNLFTARAANVSAGERVGVRLEYIEELRHVDGRFSFAFPLTFTPRFSPQPAPERAEIPLLAGSPPPLPATPWVRVNHPGAPRVALRVRLDAGTGLASVGSTSHTVTVRREGDAAVIEPASGPIAADRDFLLAWTPALSPQPSATLFLEDRDEGRFGALLVFPPQDGAASAEGLPTDTIFVVDTSGSMAGPSIVQAQRALAAALARLRLGDGVALIRFSDDVSSFSAGIEPVSWRTIERAQAWVGDLSAGGGTQIGSALEHALDLFDASRSSREARLILVTDGAVDNEQALFSRVRERLGRARLHVVGIGSAPNRWLMRKLAEAGRGHASFIAGGDEVESAMNDALERIDRPVLADVELDWEGAAPLEVYPARLPDLYAGETMRVVARFAGDGVPERAILRGRARGGEVEMGVAVHPIAAGAAGPGVLWARAKVESLLDGLKQEGDLEWTRDEVLRVALPFRLVTRYTSLVAVERHPTVEGPAIELAIPTTLPDGSVLAQGGTIHPLLARLGLLLMAAGGAGLLLARRWGVA